MLELGMGKKQHRAGSTTWHILPPGDTGEPEEEPAWKCGRCCVLAGSASWVSGTSGLECWSSLLTDIVRINSLTYEIGIARHSPSTPSPGLGIKTRTWDTLGKCCTVGSLPSPHKAVESDKDDLKKQETHRAHGVGTVCPQNPLPTSAIVTKYLRKINSKKKIA